MTAILTADSFTSHLRFQIMIFASKAMNVKLNEGSIFCPCVCTVCAARVKTLNPVFFQHHILCPQVLFSASWYQASLLLVVLYLSNEQNNEQDIGLSLVHNVPSVRYSKNKIRKYALVGENEKMLSNQFNVIDFQT